MSNFARVILITLDGVGVGALPDAVSYGDSLANTLLHVAEGCGGLKLPQLGRLGLGSILEIPGVPRVLRPAAHFGRMREASVGKDTTTGHWELAGIIQKEPFATYPLGFPDEIISAFTRETGLVPLGNISASGTDIIRQLGEKHMQTGQPIVYTSVDSVFQIAAHEEIIPLDRLYEICRITRRILDSYRVGRVIARPFRGICADDFCRTSHRHDYSLPPGSATVLDDLIEAGHDVYAIGKISDIFAGSGISQSVTSLNNHDGMVKTMVALDVVKTGLIFTNLVDFDMHYGHRRDVFGFGEALEAFDAMLPGLLDKLNEDDLLIITADHGCDPTTPGCDHSREYVPILCWRKNQVSGSPLGERETFADVAATIGKIFGLQKREGESLL